MKPNKSDWERSREEKQTIHVVYNRKRKRLHPYTRWNEDFCKLITINEFVENIKD